MKTLKHIFVTALALSHFACGPVETAAAETFVPDSKMDRQSTTTPVVRFAADWSVAPSAPIVRDERVRISYEAKRMYQIVDSSGNAGSWAGYFASSFHCYGYGCCDVTFPAIYAHYRFSTNDGFVDTALDANGALAIDVPGNADHLELWFDIDRFSMKTWYCGCDAQCADQNRANASAREHGFRAYDSRYGENFFLALQ